MTCDVLIDLLTLYKFATACTAIRDWLVSKRCEVMAAMRLHPVLKKADLKGISPYIQECVNFFNKSFTHLVCEVTGKEFVGGGGAVMRLGGGEDTDALDFLELDVGPYEEKNLLALNKPIWEAMEERSAVA